VYFHIQRYLLYTEESEKYFSRAPSKQMPKPNSRRALRGRDTYVLYLHIYIDTLYAQKNQSSSSREHRQNECPTPILGELCEEEIRMYEYIERKNTHCQNGWTHKYIDIHIHNGERERERERENQRERERARRARLSMGWLRSVGSLKL